MELPHDEEGAGILARLGRSPSDYLGHGGESWVYALDEARVVRVLRGPGGKGLLRRRQPLIDELVRGIPPFDLPQILEIDHQDDRWYSIERRLTGTSALKLLPTLSRNDRDALIENHLLAVAALADLPLEPRGWYGELIADDPIRTSSWIEFLEARAETSLAAAGEDFVRIDARSIAEAFPEPERPGFVHVDAFTGNMLAEGTTITAVFDFGASVLSGDSRLDPLAAVVYLWDRSLTPEIDERDADVARSWLRNSGLDELFEPARRWIASYWSFSVQSEGMMRWCRDILGLES